MRQLSRVYMSGALLVFKSLQERSTRERFISDFLTGSCRPSYPSIILTSLDEKLRQKPLTYGSRSFMLLVFRFVCCLGI